MAARDTAPLLVGLLVLLRTWGAWATVEVSMEDRVEVFRGETAQITCMFTSADGIGGMTIKWFYVTRLSEKRIIYTQDTTMKVVERGTPYTDRISVNGTGATGEVVLTISDVRLEDELEFICSIESLTDGIGEGLTKLRVFEKPEIPTIEAIKTGISVNEENPVKIGVCEVKNGYPKPNITWYRDNMPLQNQDGGRKEEREVRVQPSITTESSGLFSVRSTLSFKAGMEEKDAQFHCEVRYFVPGGIRMIETNCINITIYYPSTALRIWVESPKGKIKEGDTVEIHCLGNGNSPSSITSIMHDDKTHEVSKLVLDGVTRLNSGLYQCNIMDMDTFDVISGNITVFVNYLDTAVVDPENTTVVAQGEELRATCNALSSLQTHVTWWKNKEEVSKGHTLILKDATFDAAGTYECLVTVPEIEGMVATGELNVDVTGPPIIMKPDNTEIEETFESSVDLSCHVRGFPAPTITWSTSDGKILKTTSQKKTTESIQSVVSIKVTSDVTAFCNASNEYGTDSLTFSIKATIHTTTQATTTTTSTSSSTTISSTTETIAGQKVKKEGSGVVIAVIIICILLLAILGSVLYFLYKKGKICGRSGKQDLTKERSNRENIVIEMKSDNTEEAILLGVNGEKQPPNDQ